MDCKEFEKLIPNFIEKRMDYPTLKRFAAHIESCPECEEELTIQYLVTVGTQSLEDGRAFDLQKELRTRMEESVKKLKFHDFFMTFGTVLEVLFVVILLGAIIWILL